MSESIFCIAFFLSHRQCFVDRKSLFSKELLVDAINPALVDDDILCCCLSSTELLEYFQKRQEKYGSHAAKNIYRSFTNFRLEIFRFVIFCTALFSYTPPFTTYITHIFSFWYSFIFVHSTLYEN